MARPCKCKGKKLTAADLLPPLPVSVLNERKSMTPEKIHRINSAEQLAKSMIGGLSEDPKLAKLVGETLWLASQVKADPVAQQPDAGMFDKLTEVTRELDKTTGEVVNLQAENSMLLDKLSKSEAILNSVSSILEVSSFSEIEGELRSRLDFGEDYSTPFDDEDESFPDDFDEPISESKTDPF